MRSWWIIGFGLALAACGTTKSDGSGGKATFSAPPPHPIASDDPGPSGGPVGTAPAERWEATGADGTRYVLEAGDPPRLVPADGVIAGPGAAGESCVEVVGMEADAMLVKVGTIADGKCVLSETVLRFARQAQR